ncbi:MAG: Sec-independent protein translocase protein TatB [Spongiibacteraceae bacterium]
MFDVSFGELLLILIVGLLVFGPEKLPHAVRTASQWMARARRSFNQVRADIEREVGVDEIKRDFHNQSILESLRDVKKDLTDAQRELDQLPYDVDQRVRDNFLMEREQAEIDAAQMAIPHGDFKHNDTTGTSQQNFEQQDREIENSIHARADTKTETAIAAAPGADKNVHNS